MGDPRDTGNYVLRGPSPALFPNAYRAVGQNPGRLHHPRPNAGESYDDAIRRVATPVELIPSIRHGGSSEILSYLMLRNANGGGDEICIICQDLLRQRWNRVLGMLHCGHEFHVDCITEWLQQHRKSTCPFCRTYIVRIEAKETR